MAILYSSNRKLPPSFLPYPPGDNVECLLPCHMPPGEQDVGEMVPGEPLSWLFFTEFFPHAVRPAVAQPSHPTLSKAGTERT